MTHFEALDQIRKAFDQGKLTDTSFAAMQNKGLAVGPRITTEREFMQRLAAVEIAIAEAM